MSINSTRVEKNTASPSSITAISNTFTAISTVRLLTASARWPEYPLKSRNGATNTAPASDRYSPPDAAEICTARMETTIL